MPRSLVYSKLPHAGLGNKLLVWARAEVFAKQNKLPHYTSHWSQIKIGPYIRGEQSKRQYWRHFSNDFSPTFLDKIHMATMRHRAVEPDVQSILQNAQKRQSKLYVFDRVPDWQDYFLGLRSHEPHLRGKFRNILHPRFQRDYQPTQYAPVVGLHVRRGDFRELREGEILGEHCNVRTPISYYIDVLNELRKLCGQNLPATIFTDGRQEDVKELLAIPNVSMPEQRSDVLDMLMLSSSQIIVPSIASTFSYWAAFISDAIVITHPAHDVRIRGEGKTKYLYEGTIPTAPQGRDRLAKSLQDLCS